MMTVTDMIQEFAECLQQLYEETSKYESRGTNSHCFTLYSTITQTERQTRVHLQFILQYIQCSTSVAKILQNTVTG